MLVRYSASVAMGAAVTFSLLFLMQHLISMGEEVFTPPPKGPPIKLVKIERDEEPRSKRERPEPPEERPLPPPREFPPHKDDRTGRLVVQIAGPPSVVPPDTTPIAGYGSSGDLLPIVAVAPVYPARALARHLEGYVVVEYTVTVTGGVRDAYVVASSSGVFDRAALEAAYKFKYKPRVVDGQPVEVPGVQRKFSFVIEN